MRSPLKWFSKKDELGHVPIEVVLPDNEEPGKLDPSSPTWRFVVRTAEAELEQLREELEMNLDSQQTANIRGQISRLKWLLDLPKEVSRDDAWSRLKDNRQGFPAG